MDTKLDAGFFEPFRNNITSIDPDGNFEAIINSGVSFDKDVIVQYFDDAVVEYHKNSGDINYTCTFKGRAKTQEMTDILRCMVL